MTDEKVNKTEMTCYKRKIYWCGNEEIIDFKIIIYLIELLHWLAKHFTVQKQKRELI